MRPLLFFILFLLSRFSCALSIDELQQRFSLQPVVRAQFEQVRRIKDLPQPLRSKGEIIIARDKGLFWSQEKPFSMVLLLDDKKMVQVINDQTQVVTAESNPQMFQFNHLLRALFQADRKVLEQNFKISFQDQGAGHWQLVLTPISSPLDKIFSDLTLQGRDVLENIVLNDKQGDRTNITFGHHQLTPSTLTDDELKHFLY